MISSRSCDSGMIGTMDDPIGQLADAIHRERVERARRQPLEDKFLAGGILFDNACELTKAGIRMQFPHFSEEQVTTELRRRLELRRRREYRDGEVER